MHTYLEFERPIAELEGKIVELRKLAEEDPAMQIEAEVGRLQARADGLIKDTYSKLTGWQKVQVARHPGRPHFTDYARQLFDEFTPLAGDRSFGEDNAIIAALARFRGRAVAVLGHEKGNDTKTRLKHNFGMAMPEGYRKAQRMFEMADRFGLPVISLVDTSGAYNGVAAEERGQSEAIARSTQAGLEIRVPFVTTIIGEGGSGGALAIGVGDHLAMLEFSTYSVISPEGCASILWKSADRAADAAEVMGITSKRLKELKLIDEIIKEPLGGAHRDADASAQAVKRALAQSLARLNTTPVDKLVQARYRRLMGYGVYKG